MLVMFRDIKNEFNCQAGRRDLLFLRFFGPLELEEGFFTLAKDNYLKTFKGEKKHV